MDRFGVQRGLQISCGFWRQGLTGWGVRRGSRYARRVSGIGCGSIWLDGSQAFGPTLKFARRSQSGGGGASGNTHARLDLRIAGRLVVLCIPVSPVVFNTSVCFALALRLIGAFVGRLHRGSGSSGECFFLIVISWQIGQILTPVGIFSCWLVWLILARILTICLAVGRFGTARQAGRAGLNAFFTTITRVFFVVLRLHIGGAGGGRRLGGSQSGGERLALLALLRHVCQIPAFVGIPVVWLALLIPARVLTIFFVTGWLDAVRQLRLNRGSVFAGRRFGGLREIGGSVFDLAILWITGC